ncbi:MAG: glutathione S-transferase family protein [bacterium]
MKLYGMGKSRSFRALWALEEAQVEYDYIPVEFGHANQHGAQSPEYKCLNTQGKVPTLVDGDFVLTESGAIMNYIGAKYPQSKLLPTDLQQRARYDEICTFILTELEQALWTSGKHTFALPEEQRIPAVLPTANWEFEKAQKALLCLIDHENFLLGDQFSMADILLAHTIGWAYNFKFPVEPVLLEYRKRMTQRPAYRRASDLIST